MSLGDPVDHREQLAAILLESNATALFVPGSDNKGLPHRLTGREAKALAAFLVSKGVQLSEERPSLPPDAPCSVCGGRPLASGRDCICGGRGTEYAEAQGLRERLVDLEIALGLVREAVRSVDSLPKPTEESLPYHVAGAWAAGYNAGRASVAAPEETKS